MSQVIRQALQWDIWHPLDDTTCYQSIALCHYGMAQRWLVVSSQAALERADKSVANAQQRELEALKTQLFHLHAKRFETPEAAQAALAVLANAWRYHQIDTTWVIDHKRYACNGRPTPTSPIKSIEWQIQAQVRPDQEVIETRKYQSACYGIGTNVDARQLSDAQVRQAYQAQAQAEGGFRFLKALVFFVSSLFVKKPSRMQGLLMVMTLALLV